MKSDPAKPQDRQAPQINRAADQGVDAAAQRQLPPLDGGNLSGALPSNTAPANYIDDPSDNCQTLRCGVDSLYLSYRGELSSEWSERLELLKETARSKAESEQALAQVKIGEHLFEVKPKGRGKFTYVLVDNCFHIAISGNGAHSLPLAYVQVSSELLTAAGPLQAEQALNYVVHTLGRSIGSPSVSRADLFVDFTTEAPIHSWPPTAWITRAHRLDMHHVRRQFSGWSIGMGGDIGARLYDKTLEIQKSKKDYLKFLWADTGWQEGQTVWRLEFQFKRQVLGELGVIKTTELLASLGGLWQYATETWLRLTIPHETDTNQTRWPTHPIWQCLANIDWETPAVPTLARVRTTRIPSDETLFVNGLGPITSFMAREGITELKEGFRQFLAGATDHHDTDVFSGGFARYIKTKVALKGKKYNSIRNENPKEAALTKAQAETYRKQRDGE